MSELRAPDPTLTTLDRRLVLVEPGAPHVAHRMSDEAGCGRLSDIDWNERASEARWFAVPCRDCFPDAAAPGHRRETCSVDGEYEFEDDRLAWQTPS
jgi:hypothetical protein